MAFLFPTLPGIAWPITKAPQFTTKIQTSVSGAEYRLTYQPQPRWLFTLKLDFLRDRSQFDELREIMGFFMRCQGSLQPFYFEDPTDNQVTGQFIGVTDGLNLNFPLIRTVANSFSERVRVINLTQPINVYFDGGFVPQPNNWDIGSEINPYLNFPFGTSSGNVITMDFNYYFYCRFADDTNAFSNFMNGLWSSELKFQSLLN